jgi:peptidoglycan/xylan/chitin deacetylase (PgdA/CDA1 family)
MPLLDQYGVKATMFVCPGYLDTDEPYWWDRVSAHEVARLTVVPDVERRRVVAATPPGAALQLTTNQLKAWVGAGRSIGNHTWDHPCLDRCAAAEQVSQVRLAHEWLREHAGPEATTSFVSAR